MHVPPGLVAQLWISVAAVAVFLVVAVILGFLQPGYDPWHQAVSALSLGPHGWIQNLNFVMLGAGVLSTVPVWRRVLSQGYGERAYPVFTALLGFGFLIAAVVPQDPAPGYDPQNLQLTARTTMGSLHLSIAGIAALSAVAAMSVMARRFAAHPEWRGWAFYSRAMASAMLVCIAIYGVWSTRATGLAGTFERLAIAIPGIWGYTFLRRLGRSVPFMNDTHLR